MARFDFAVPSMLTFSIEADTQEEAIDLAQWYVEAIGYEGAPAPPGNDDVSDPTWCVLDDVDEGDLVDTSKPIDEPGPARS